VAAGVGCAGLADLSLVIGARGAENGFQLERRVAGDRLEVAVVVQERGAMADRRHRDETVELAPQCLAGCTTCAIDVSRFLEVGKSLQPEDRSADQPRPDVRQALTRSGTSEHFHQDRLSDGDVGVLLDQPFEHGSGGRPTAAEQIDPG